MQLIETELKRNPELENENLSSLHEQISRECKTYQHHRQQYLSFLLIGKYEEKKKKMLKSEAERWSNQITQFDQSSKTPDPNMRTPTRVENNENKYNHRRKASKPIALNPRVDREAARADDQDDRISGKATTRI